MANISRPIKPWLSQTARTAANTRAMSSLSVLTNGAIVVKWGALSPQSAMKVTCSWQARSMPRLLTMPCEYANSTTFNNIAGGYAGAPVASFRKRASKCDRSISWSSR